MTAQLIKNGESVQNDWLDLADDATLPEGRKKLIVSLGRLRAERESLSANAAALGLRLPNTEDVSPLSADLKDVALIALVFPTAPDGRAFSQARLLRQRLGFRGELRATGDVLRDQLQFMLRCGFDAFELRADQDLETCLKAFADFDLAYQSASDSVPNVWALRRSAV